MPSKVGSELVFNGASSIAAQLPNGNFVVTYQNGPNAYVQVVSQSGVLAGNPNQLGSSLSNVTVLPNGNFLVIYQLLNGPSYVQVINANGALIGSSNQCTTFVTALSNGNFLVAYGSAPNTQLQMIDPSGNLVGTSMQGVFQTLLVGGNFVVVYPSGSNYYAQVVAPSGAMVGSPIQVILGNGMRQTVTLLPNGNFIVGYMAGSNCYAQIVSANSTLVGSPMSCGTSTTLELVTLLSNGNFVLGYNASGTSYLNIFNVNATLLSQSSYSGITQNNFIPLPNGAFLLIYSVAPGIGGGIWMQLVNANGIAIGRAISTSTLNATILSNGNFITMNLSPGSGYSVLFVTASTGSAAYINTGGSVPPVYTIVTLPSSNFIFTLQNGAIYSVQFYTGNGAAVGTAIQATTNPTVTLLPNGGCVLAYTNGSNSYLQIFNAAGALVGSAIPAGNNINNVTVLESGNFFAVTYQSGLTYYAQMVSVNGGLVGSAIQAIVNPSITTLPDGNSLVVYQTGVNSCSGQLFDANAVPVTTAFQLGSISGNSVLTLGSDYFIVKWQTPDTNTHVQLFYAGTNLTVVNANQNVDYLQDASQTDFNEITVLTEYNQANATLTLSDPQAGTLTTPMSGNSTATFSPQTGVWEVSGDVNDVNTVLNHTKFIPAPNYVANFTLNLTVNDVGNRTQNGLLNWVGAPTPPALINNTLNVTVGETVTVTSSDLGISPKTRPVTFTVSDLQGGYFQLTSNPGQSILQFTQQEVNAQKVQFVSDQTAPVSYHVSVSDGRFTLSPALASVVFINNAPTLVGTVSPEVLPINTPFRFAVSADQIFANANSNASSLTFFAKLTSNSPLPSWINFTAPQANQLVFSGNPNALGSTAVDLCASAPLNKTTCTDFNVLVVPTNTTGPTSGTNTNTTINNNVNSGNPIVAPVAAALGTATLLVGAFATGFSIWRCAKNNKSQENHELAKYVQGILKMQGVDDFNSRKGRDYVAAINVITDNLSHVHGIDVSKMRSDEVRSLATEIANSARNKISPVNTFFRGSIITAVELNSKAQDIAKEVASNRTATQPFVPQSGLSVSSDDSV